MGPDRETKGLNVERVLDAMLQADLAAKMVALQDENAKLRAALDDAGAALEFACARNPQTTDFVPAEHLGLKLVQTVATDLMMTAGERALLDTGRPGATWAEHTGNIWAAMVAAAPDRKDGEVERLRHAMREALPFCMTIGMEILESALGPGPHERRGNTDTDEVAALRRELARAQQSAARWKTAVEIAERAVERAERRAKRKNPTDAETAVTEERARIAASLRKIGATLPAPEVKGTPESGIITGLCIALTLVEDGPNVGAKAPT